MAERVYTTHRTIVTKKGEVKTHTVTSRYTPRKPEGFIPVGRVSRLLQNATQEQLKYIYEYLTQDGTPDIQGQIHPEGSNA